MKRQSFAKFCMAYGFELTHGQRVLSSVSFDGAEPVELDAEDRAIAAELFGHIESVPAAARSVVVIVKGARVGGTRMSAMRLYQLGNTVPLSVAPGEKAYGLIVGPDMRLARQALNYARASAQRDAKHEKIIMLAESKDSFEFERHDGANIVLECLPATAGGSAVRGRTLFGAVKTEAAFFRDKDFVINDVEVYRAIAPRIVPGGQLIIESTPWAATGLVYEFFRDNFGDPKTALVSHCPTLAMRDDEHTIALVARERQRDPDNAAREFDAQFMSAGSEVFFDPVLIDRAMQEAA